MTMAKQRPMGSQLHLQGLSITHKLRSVLFVVVGVFVVAELQPPPDYFGLLCDIPMLHMRHKLFHGGQQLHRHQSLLYLLRSNVGCRRRCITFITAVVLFFTTI
jgi:hypothetical protein